MRALTKKAVIDKLQLYVARHISQAAAARAAGVTAAQLSDALADKIPVPAKLLKKIRVQRLPMYVVGEDTNRYQDGDLTL